MGYRVRETCSALRLEGKIQPFYHGATHFANRSPFRHLVNVLGMNIGGKHLRRQTARGLTTDVLSLRLFQAKFNLA